MHLTSYLNVVWLKNRATGTGPQVALELVVEAEAERAYAVNWDNHHGKSAERTPLGSISIETAFNFSLRNVVWKKTPSVRYSRKSVGCIISKRSRLES